MWRRRWCLRFPRIWTTRNSTRQTRSSSTPPKTTRGFVPFVLISPLRDDPLEDLENALARGARGVKLINGHGDYYQHSRQDVIDPPGLRKMFAYCQERGIPILWHVNSHLYRAGLFRVLKDFPRLKVVNPHVGGYLTYAPAIVRQLLRDYPNFYVDFSWGMQAVFLRRALEDISFQADEWRALVLEFPDRFLFGSDVVASEQRRWRTRTWCTSCTRTCSRRRRTTSTTSPSAVTARFSKKATIVLACED